MHISVDPLLAVGDWEKLRLDLDGGYPRDSIDQILNHLRELGCKSFCAEDVYLDRDHSDDFLNFYARSFSMYSKYCRRYHFFHSNICPHVDCGNLISFGVYLQTLSPEQYLGFVVVRPLSQAPIGRTILRAREDTGYDSITVRASYEVNLLGARLAVMGVPFIEQDSVVGSCAQVSLWIASRHFHQKFRHPWFSLSDITRLAGTPTEAAHVATLPEGSDGLSYTGLIRALKAMGFQPFLKLLPGVVGVPSSENVRQAHGLQQAARTVEPMRFMARYVDSGLPVIVGFVDQRDRAWGHTVTVIGQHLRPSEIPGVAPEARSRPDAVSRKDLDALPRLGDYCSWFLGHDDVRGPYRRMWQEANSDEYREYYDINKALGFLLVPMPAKVNTSAEMAEVVSLDALYQYISRWPDVIKERSPGSSELMDSFANFYRSVVERKILIRTYLTTGSSYKQRVLRSSMNEQLRLVILGQDLPRMVYVTEFCHLPETVLHEGTVAPKAVLGHTVIDPTSPLTARSPRRPTSYLLITHFPGLVTCCPLVRISSVEEGGERNGTAERALARLTVDHFLEGDKSYEPRTRE